MGDQKRICVIRFGQMADADRPEVVCYEKQTTWSGQWNYTWRTGSDEYGEPVHSSMYHHLWANGPKECLQFPDYTFDEHFGKATPSYPPMLVLRKYLEGEYLAQLLFIKLAQLATGSLIKDLKSCKSDLKQFIRFSTVVKEVSYNDDANDFTVRARDLTNDKETTERFTHVIAAVGIFSVPHMPDFPGIDEFPGRVLHAHNFRDAREYKGQRLLLIGASFSAEDIALQCRKYGAGHIICTWRTKPMGFKFPDGIEERPLLQKVDGNTVSFKDGTSAEVDVIILCTGYLYSYPFLPDELRLQSRLSYYPDNLYKGMVFMKGGMHKLLYLGTQDQYFTFTMFDVQGAWACKYIMGDIKLPSTDEMTADIAKWMGRVRALNNCHEDIEFQADYVEELGVATGYHKDVSKARQLIHEWEKCKDEDVATYRDKACVSVFTGTKATLLKDKWMDIFDDSVEYFVQ